jgi:hypothetical protein
MVLIGELASLTPSNIRLINLKINLEPAQAGDASKQAKDAPKTQIEKVTVEGLILGKRQLFETSLIGYTMAMEASPFFRQAIIQKNTIEPYIEGEALHFIMNLKVEEQVHV